jgi:hypothetical protein
MALTLRTLSLCLIGAAGAALGTASVQSVHAAKKPVPALGQPSTPEIMMTAQNRVPACIDPARLDQTLAARNPGLEQKFRGIAQIYKTHGEKLGVRWDYAFYQMVLETNSLKFTGDVRARQNNFAGLGATGGGVPGESFADVSSGVLAQLQHLVAYAGIKVENPVAKRTRENQDDIIVRSKKLGRAVRFADLTNRWAADGRYARSIDTLATLFRDAACAGRETPVAAAQPQTKVPQVADAGQPASPAQANPAQASPAASTKRRQGRDLARKAIEDNRDVETRPSGLGAAAPAAAATAVQTPVTAAPASQPPAVQPPNAGATPVAARPCNVMAASFGGTTTLLIRAEVQGSITFTALGVEDANADAMAQSYIGAHAPGGRITGRFPSQDDAIARAYALCDSGRP